jgi:hypothetical protein
VTGLELEDLTDRITERAGRLEGPREAAALVEWLHPADVRGSPLAPEDALDLGGLVFEQQTLDPGSARRAIAVEESRRRVWSDLRARIGPGPRRPPAQTIPVLVALASVAALTLPRWAQGRPDAAGATAIGVGAVASMVVAAGFVFALDRISANSAGRGASDALGRCLRTAGVGVVTAALAGLGLEVVLRTLPMVPKAQVGGATVVYAVLSITWLSLATAAAAIRLRRSGRPVAASPSGGVPAAPERRALAIPFAYGLALVGFLLVDRVLAWAGTPHSRPLHLWFRASSELALAWGLVCAVPAFVLAAIAARRMVRLLPRAAFAVPLPRRDLVSARMTGWYRRTAGWLFAAGLTGAAGGVMALRAVARAVPWMDRLVTPKSLAVCAAAAVSYVLVAWSMVNQGIAFALRREGFALWAVVPALLADLAVGVGLAHFVAYRLAVAGLLAGSMVLCALSTRFGLTLLGVADHSYYAAF